MYPRWACRSFTHGQLMAHILGRSRSLVDDITAGKLPTFGLLIPDVCHDGHDCSAATTDDWLRSWLPTIMKGPDFQSNRLAIVVTWDEDEDHSGNRIPICSDPSLL
jgi:hypothetical protein